MEAGSSIVHAQLMLNPLRSEEEAFRALLYVLGFVVAAIAIILIARAIF